MREYRNILFKSMIYGLDPYCRVASRLAMTRVLQFTEEIAAPLSRSHLPPDT
jgi:hypothetical protein